MVNLRRVAKQVAFGLTAILTRTAQEIADYIPGEGKTDHVLSEDEWMGNSLLEETTTFHIESEHASIKLTMEVFFK